MKYTPAFIRDVLQGELLQNEAADSCVEYLCTDTRKIIFPAQSVFIALVTKHRNGHTFLQAAYDAGIRCFIVSEAISEFPGSSIIKVSHTLEALQSLGSFKRHEYHYPVIGITGSNGKTIVKEWLYQLLQDEKKIIRSPRSYNSQVGVPLSVWEMNEAAELAIFEAGISAPGEMQTLQKIIDPTIGLITHIGDAHKEGFDSVQQKIKEKLLLFTNSEAIIYNNDDELLNVQVNGMNALKFSWGSSESSSVKVEAIHVSDSSTEIVVWFDNKKYSFKIPFTTKAAIENAITCFTVCCYLKINPDLLVLKMPLLQQMDMRLQLQKGSNNCIIINDSYSFDLDSLQTALDFLVQQQQTYKPTVILSDLPDANEQDHLQVVSMLKDKKIRRAILVGAEWMKLKEIVSNDFPSAEFFESGEQFSGHFSATHFQHEIILVKGARHFRFDELLPLFQHQVHQTIMQINLSAMLHNLTIFRQQLNKGVKVMAMVKAFGYGSGGAELAKFLSFHQVDYLAVAYADEGIALRKEGISLPILVLNVDESAFHSIVEYDLEPEIFSFYILNAFKKFLGQQGINAYPVHLKIDTGMHRLGFEEKDIPSLIEILTRDEVFIIRSVFSHLVASEDEAMDAFTLQQFNSFKNIAASIQQEVRHTFFTHISNSAAIFRHKALQMDMVRLGIGLYGVQPVKDMPLQTVVTVKTTVAQTRKVAKGDSVGYNRKGIVERDSVIATLRIGYADGYRRNLGNGIGKVFIKGKFAPVIGNVCMDMLMIDITDIPGVTDNEPVEILGENIRVEEMAEWCGTIPYEILTSIGQRVKRVYSVE